MSFLTKNLTVKRLGFGNKGQTTIKSERQIFPGHTTTADNLACPSGKQNYLYEGNDNKK